jgi:hypothetical protein
MTTALIPDAEKVVSRYLREHEDVTAVCPRIVATMPGTGTGGTDTAWVRVLELAGPSQSDSKADHLVTFLLQIDCYAGRTGGQPEAKLIARTVRAALNDMPGSHDGAVVTAVRNAGWRRVPDTDFEPARERVIVTATAVMHS